MASDAPSVAVEVQQRDAWQVMDSWDDEQILAELEGRVTPGKKLVYKFRQAGQEVIGLGKEGVDLCCQILIEQGQVIRELELRVEYDGEGVSREALFFSKAGRFAVAVSGELMLDTVIGTKRQPLYRANREGELEYNPHWFEQGATKALRNARLRLLPLRLREFVMAQALKSNRVQSNDTPQDEARRPATPEQRKLYTQMLGSHHVTEAEREKALKWLAARRHSFKALGAQIDALAELIRTRTESEKKEKGYA